LEVANNFFPRSVIKLDGPTILGKMELPVEREKELHKRPISLATAEHKRKRKRKRIKKDNKVSSAQEIVTAKPKKILEKN